MDNQLYDGLIWNGGAACTTGWVFGQVSQPKLVLIFFFMARLRQLAHALLQDLLAEFVPEFDKAAFIFVAVLLVLLLAVPGFDFGDELIIEFVAHGRTRSCWEERCSRSNIKPS